MIEESTRIQFQASSGYQREFKRDQFNQQESQQALRHTVPNRPTLSTTTTTNHHAVTAAIHSHSTSPRHTTMAETKEAQLFGAGMHATNSTTPNIVAPAMNQLSDSVPTAGSRSTTTTATGPTPFSSPVKPTMISNTSTSPRHPNLTPTMQSRPSGTGTTGTPPPRPKVQLYRNEEVILFRTPSDASHIVLFNLPLKPFIHGCYDLKTVAKARKDADEAMRRERGEEIPIPMAVTDSNATNSNVTTVPPGSAGLASPTTNPTARAITTPHTSITSASSTLLTGVHQSPAVLAASYHAMHLQNIERVLHSLANKYGLVHELSIQCKPRANPSESSRRRRLSNPFDEEESSANQSPIEEYESTFLIWAYIKYYSVLHAGVAVKALNRIALGTGKKLKAKFIDRQPKLPPPPPFHNSTNNSPSKGTDVSSSTNPPPSTATPALSSSVPVSSTTTPNAPPLNPYFPLSSHRCLDLCNYFLGFNNWSCEIKEIRKYDPTRDEELMDDTQLLSADYRASCADRFRSSWTATVLVVMAGQSFICSGVGHTERREDASRAKKKAVSNAYRQLFASLALVILHNGKVAVQVLP